MTGVSSRNADVAADMAAIFATTASRRTPPAMAAAAPGAMIARATPRASRGRKLLRTLVLLALLAVAGAVMLGRPQDAPRVTLPAEPKAATVAERATVPAPVPPTPVPPAPVPTPTPTPSPTPSASGTSAPVPKPASTATADRTSPAAKAGGDAAGIDIARSPDQPRAGSRCSGDPDGCLYDRVRAADDRLVRAYQRARFAGVPIAELRDVRRRWDRALARSLDEPGETIRAYDALADELEDARARTARRAE